MLLNEDFPDIPEVGDPSFHVYRRDDAGEYETADKFMESQISKHEREELEV